MHFLAKVMPKFSVNFGMTCARKLDISSAGNVGSSSQPPSTKVDRVPMKHAPLIHVAGEPMVPGMH